MARQPLIGELVPGSVDAEVDMGLLKGEYVQTLEESGNGLEITKQDETGTSTTSTVALGRTGDLVTSSQLDRLEDILLNETTLLPETETTISNTRAQYLSTLTVPAVGHLKFTSNFVAEGQRNVGVVTVSELLALNTIPDANPLVSLAPNQRFTLSKLLEPDTDLWVGRTASNRIVIQSSSLSGSGPHRLTVLSLTAKSSLSAGDVQDLVGALIVGATWANNAGSAAYNTATNTLTFTINGRTVTVSTSAPSGPSHGDLWSDTSANILKFYNGTTWINIGPGITLAQVRSEINSNSKIVSFGEFEAALRQRTNIVSNASVTVTSGTVNVRIPGNPSLPDAKEDRAIIATVNPPNGTPVTQRFDLSNLYAKPAIPSFTGLTTLSTSNAEAFNVGTDGNVYFARLTVAGQNDQFLFSADTVGNYVITLQDDVIDILDSARDETARDNAIKDQVFDWAEQGNTDPIPAGKLVNAPSGGGTGGLTQTQVDARVAAGVQDWAETGNNAAIPAAKLSNAPQRSNSDIDGRVRAGVADWAEQGNNAAIPAAKLSNAPGLTETQVKAEIKGYAQADNAVDLIGRNDLDANQRIPVGTEDQFVKFNSAGHLIATAEPSGGNATFLEPSATLPAVADHDSGDILDYLGEFYVLKTDDLHVLTGTLGESGNFFGGNNISGSTNFGTINGTTAEFAFPKEGFDPSPLYTVRLLIPKSGVTTTPQALYIRIILGDGQTIEDSVHRSTSNDTTNYWSYRGGSTRPYTEGAHLDGQTFQVQLFTNEAMTTTYNIHGTKRWEPYNVAESKYIPPVVPQLHGTIPVFSGPATGLSVTNSSQNFIQSLQLAGTVAGTERFDLDDSDKQHGEFHIELSIVLNERSSTSQSLDEGSIVTRRVLSDLLFASTLRNSEDWVSTTTIADLEGELVFTQDVYNGTTKRGELRLYLAHNSNNEIGYAAVYVGSSASETFAFGLELNVNFVGNDVPASTGPVSPGQPGTGNTAFQREAVPSANVDVTIPGSVAITQPNTFQPPYSAWVTIVSLSAITDAEAGVVNIAADMEGKLTGDSGGGGDRCVTQFRLIKNSSEVVRETIYGPRNLPGSDSFNTATTALYAEESEKVAGTLALSDTAASGDVYAIQARAIQQEGGGSDAVADKTLRFTATDNHLYISGHGQGSGTGTGSGAAKGDLVGTVTVNDRLHPAGSQVIATWTARKTGYSVQGTSLRIPNHLGAAIGHIITVMQDGNVVSVSAIPASASVASARGRWTANNKLEPYILNASGTSKALLLLEYQRNFFPTTALDAFLLFGNGEATSSVTIEIHEWV